MKNNLVKKTILLLGLITLTLPTLVKADNPENIELAVTLQRAKVTEKVRKVQEQVTASIDNEIKVAQEAEEKKKAEAEAAKQKELAEKEKKAAEQANNTPPANAANAAPVTGREIGETNREYGRQLSDPNLTPAERRAIIEEKKAYNQSHRGGR